MRICARWRCSGESGTDKMKPDISASITRFGSTKERLMWFMFSFCSTFQLHTRCTIWNTGEVKTDNSASAPRFRFGGSITAYSRGIYSALVYVFFLWPIPASQPSSYGIRLNYSRTWHSISKRKLWLRNLMETWCPTRNIEAKSHIPLWRFDHGN